jgi:protein SCO1/2
MKKLLTMLVMAVLLAGCDKVTGRAPSFENTDVTGLEYGKGFSLVDHTGKPRTLADFRGKVVLMFFGYTQCPDVCPTTMIEMARVMKELGPQADQVQVLFVTLDPQRDTREVLSQYVPAFDKRFIGLYGDAAQTAAVAREFKIFYAKVPGSNAGNYTLDHTAGTYVFDRDGKLRLFVRNGQDPRSIVHDIRQLLS